MIEDVKFIMPTKKGNLRKYDVKLEYDGNRIIFRKSPFAMKDEIKAMEGATWHGFKDDGFGKVWSVKNSPRNKFQMDYLKGENPYEWFDQPVREDWIYERPLMVQQKLMSNSCLTLHYQILAAEMGVGKTLSAIEVIEKSEKTTWWWVGPKTTLPAIELEFEKWGLDKTIKVEMMTYDRMALLVETEDYELPDGVIFDESSKLKTYGVKRQIAAQILADKIREVHGMEGYVILMSGTPSPKSPVDIWAQAEIAYPGFLREGSPKALQQRLAVLRKNDSNEFGGYFMEHVGWLDQDNLCGICCQSESEGPHEFTGEEEIDDIHAFESRDNEVAILFERLQGLMLVIHKKDCLELPEKQYRRVVLTPTKKLMRVAKSVVNVAKNTVTGLTQLRQLSDGFMYRNVPDGMMQCPACIGEGEIPQWVDPEDEERTFDSVEMFDDETVSKLIKQTRECPKCNGEKEISKTRREAYEIPCPKVEAANEWLEKAEPEGRIIIFAGYQGSVDRCVGICQAAGWDVFKCDGRGSQIITAEGKKLTTEKPLNYWSNMENEKVAFVANPESGGFGLTLIEARIMLFYSNSYKPEFRTQGEDRFHRPGQEKDVIVVDLLHLPTDLRALEIIQQNRKLEKMVLGDIVGDLLDV